jgi:putative transposase
MLRNHWLAEAIPDFDAELIVLFQTHQVTPYVGHRPGRNEPRVNKRRPKILKLMTEPRPNSPSSQSV